MSTIPTPAPHLWWIPRVLAAYTAQGLPDDWIRLTSVDEILDELLPSIDRRLDITPALEASPPAGYNRRRLERRHGYAWWVTQVGVHRDREQCRTYLSKRSRIAFVQAAWLAGLDCSVVYSATGTPLRLRFRGANRAPSEAPGSNR